MPYYYINENFFKSWSGEMPYVLGLIVTDGCISKDLHTVSLAMNDNELLEKVAAASGHEHPRPCIEASSKVTRVQDLQAGDSEGFAEPRRNSPKKRDNCLS